MQHIPPQIWWINPSRAVHSQQDHVCSPLQARPPLQADMARPHRDAPTLSIHCTPANAKLQAEPSAQEKPCYFLFCLWFVNTSIALQQLPGLYLITIKHLHEKVDKGWNSGGGLATKGPIYSVQSGRETEREGRRRSWEESWINELKMSWNSGRLNTFGFIQRGVQGGPGGVDSRGFFNFSPSEQTSSQLHLRDGVQTVLIWLHNDPVTVSQNRYCQYQRAGRHRLTAGWSSPSLLMVFIPYSFSRFKSEMTAT